MPPVLPAAGVPQQREAYWGAPPPAAAPPKWESLPGNLPGGPILFTYRAVKLQESGLITRQGMDDARTLQEAAAARIAAAKAQVTAAGEDVAHATTRLSKAVLRSPFDGTVAERLVSAGDLVGEMQKVVFRLVDNRLLELTVSVPSSEMAPLRAGQSVRFSTDAFPGREFEGKIAHINPSVSPGGRRRFRRRGDPDARRGAPRGRREQPGRRESDGAAEQP